MNVLRPQKLNDLLALVRAGYSFREIEERLNIRRETVSKYAKQFALVEGSKAATGDHVATGKSDNHTAQTTEVDLSAHGSLSPKTKQSACDIHREWIEKQVSLGRNAMSIYQDLAERFAFENAYNSVKRFVKSLKKKAPEQYDRLEFMPGEEAQVDYGQGSRTKHPKTHKLKKPRLFVMTLKYSRRSFRKVVWESSQEIWARLHEEAFRYFGGVPQYVVLDNLKEGVIKPDLYEPELNPVYAAMLSHYGAVADPARVGDPDRKGTVENAIQHTQDTALKGRQFESIEEQNTWLMHWEERWAAPRIHGRTKRQVEAMYQEEKPCLKKLPLTGFRYFKEEKRTVWDDGCIQVGDAYYAALPASIGSRVVVRIYETEIEVLAPVTLKVIRRHFKCTRAGQVKMESGDRIFNPSRQTKYLLAKAEKIGPKTKELCDLFFKEQGRPGQRKIQGIVNLAKKYTDKEIEDVAKIAIERGIRSCRSVRNMIERQSQNNLKKEDLKHQNTLTNTHQLMREMSDYGAFWEQHTLFDTENGSQYLH